jgi:N-acetylglucosaminyl-diphospho-decaprenol L-rhamnosyltransferase
VSRAPVLVVVVSYNTAPLLNDCLTALKADADAGRVAVCVVDNASTDESVALVRERHPWAALIASQENLGFGRAVNAAVREHGTHAWVAPANADTTVEPGAIAALLQAGAADPGAGVLAPRLILPDGSTQHSVHSFPTLRFTLAFQARMGDRRPAWGDEHCLPGRWNAERERRVPWAVGAFLLVREEAWQAIGGFDEALWMYAEDVDPVHARRLPVDVPRPAVDDAAVRRLRHAEETNERFRYLLEHGPDGLSTRSTCRR